MTDITPEDLAEKASDLSHEGHVRLDYLNNPSVPETWTKPWRARITAGSSADGWGDTVAEACTDLANALEPKPPNPLF